MAALGRNHPAASAGLLFDSLGVATAWVRVMGVLASLFGAYYLGAAHGEVTGSGLRSMYWATVLGRLWLCAAFCGIAASGALPARSARGLVFLGVLNLGGAASMAHQLVGGGNRGSQAA